MKTNMTETLMELTEMNITENLSQRDDFAGVKVVDNRCGELLIKLQDGTHLLVTVSEVNPADL